MSIQGFQKKATLGNYTSKCAYLPTRLLANFNF